MLSSLKNHPFAVDASFDYSLVLTYAVPQEELQHLIPPCLELDTFQGSHGFLAIAMVQTKNLRPAGFPRFLGSDFFLIGYRIFVRYTTNAGKRLRGLYILKSETDQKRMEWLGSLFTTYRYATTDVSQTMSGSIITVTSQASGLDIVADTNAPAEFLPPYSLFTNWKEARRFAGPLPFTFSYDPKSRMVVIVEGVREHWQPTPVAVLRADVPIFKAIRVTDFMLASAFIIRDIPYHWKQGRTERWNG